MKASTRISASLSTRKVNEHSGRIVKTTGDGMLVEFASVVDAVRYARRAAAVDGQSRDWYAEDRRIRFGNRLGNVPVLILYADSEAKTCDETYQEPGKLRPSTRGA